MTKDELLTKVSERLRVHRARERLTQSDVAAKLGMSQVNVSMIERGVNVLPLETLLKVAEYLGMEIKLEG